jgi:hypothetical protein
VGFMSELQKKNRTSAWTVQRWRDTR